MVDRHVPAKALHVLQLRRAAAENFLTFRRRLFATAQSHPCALNATMVSDCRRLRKTPRSRGTTAVDLRTLPRRHG